MLPSLLVVLAATPSATVEALPDPTPEETNLIGLVDDIDTFVDNMDTFFEANPGVDFAVLTATDDGHIVASVPTDEDEKAHATVVL